MMWQILVLVAAWLLVTGKPRVAGNEFPACYGKRDKSRLSPRGTQPVSTGFPSQPQNEFCGPIPFTKFFSPYVTDFDKPFLAKGSKVVGVVILFNTRSCDRVQWFKNSNSQLIYYLYYPTTFTTFTTLDLTFTTLYYPFTTLTMRILFVKLQIIYKQLQYILLFAYLNPQRRFHQPKYGFWGAIW